MIAHYCTRCREILQPVYIMHAQHLAKTSDGKQTTFELCGPVVSRNLAECAACSDPIWGKVHDVGGRKLCGRCAADERREKAD